jgi:serine/threonine protein kinase
MSVGWRIFVAVNEPIVAVPPPVVPGLAGLTVLARGGYATVYRAEQESIGRDVAVKIENRSLDSGHDRARFMREARAAARMSSHPHVVDLFDAGTTADGHPYLIMELCTCSYADRLRGTTLPAAEVRDIGAKIADALADAHELGVLHRDVKPANILMSGFGEPTLADFGLAVLTEMRDVYTALEVLTPAYAPREMFRQGCDPSPAADVYSLCATLYALLRGKPPRWQDERDPSLMTLLQLFDRPIPSLPGVPEDLMSLLRLGMSNDPARRPTARELSDWLAGREGTNNGNGFPVALRPDLTPAAEQWSMPTQPRPIEPTEESAFVSGDDPIPPGGARPVIPGQQGANLPIPISPAAGPGAGGASPGPAVGTAAGFGPSAGEEPPAGGSVGAVTSTARRRWWRSPAWSRPY